MIILAIETSCDETAFAIYDEQNGLLGHILHSQTAQLIKYGGVIPEVAARYHVQYLTPLLLQLLTKINLKLADINFIAYTKGPGLIGSLLTGIAFAKALSVGLNIPVIGVNHLEGHLLACMITEQLNPAQTNKPNFPFLALLISGGHTMLINATSLGSYQILGETLDDAAGEALDKTAKLLGLNPPNGKELSKLADLSTNHQHFKFPLPLTNKTYLNFSFSGLKTAAMLKIKKLSEDPANWTEQTKANLAYAFQKAVMDHLIAKCKLALKTTKLNQLVIAGGVSANSYLRNQLLNLSNNLNNTKIFFPKLEFCTDNAAMIAIAALLRLKQNNNYVDQNLDIVALPRWNLQDLK
ncbi:MAG: tRNA (adenosine(37)-N6)-threonylcarbamoyltransferase complex transferase subunit TsaD [Gammaproteobacteria bacterium]|jgi:N6-L-threonylcarbamoyladenine synthase